MSGVNGHYRKVTFDHTSFQGSVHDDYTIGWICTLPIEFAAAKVMLDVECPRLQARFGDQNNYTLGRIGPHYVAITCLPPEATREDAASNVATDLMRTFTQLRVILMVGIAGGAPSPSKADPIDDIRLGDVVVSKPMAGSGGAVKYDLEKTLQTGVLQREGPLIKLPPLVQLALSDLEATHLANESKVSDIITALSQSKPKVAKTFKRPGSSYDLLYEASYQHREENEDCERCDSNFLVRRRFRDTPHPSIHYGLIASAHGTLENPCARDKIRKDLGVRCFDTESAGLMEDSPCLLIRGICDYSDSHNNEMWRPYAALTAAAFAKEYLQSISPGSVASAETIKTITSRTANSLVYKANDISQFTRYAENMVTHHQQDREQNCLQAFKVCNYEHFKNINPTRLPDTCQWLIKHPLYRQWWISAENNLLWISAEPGCGKSVLARYLVDEELHKPEQQTIGYFFFKKDNEQQTKLSTALCSLLHQIFEAQPHLIQVAFPAWDRHRQQLPKQVDELWRVLSAIETQDPALQITCILDALDECDEADLLQLVDKLHDYYTKQSTDSRRSRRLKFFVTSRPINHILAKFRRIPTTAVIRLNGEDEEKHLNEEMDRVIEVEVDALAANLSLRFETATQLVSRLKSCQGRTYLWLHLVKTIILDTHNGSLLPDTELVDSIPQSVEEAYGQILNRVKEKSRHTVRQIFQIMIAARRPLTIGEMATALGVASLPDLDFVNDPTINQAHLKSYIHRWCGPFVFIYQGQLHLIHQTAEEFLVGNGTEPVNASDNWKHCLKPIDHEVLMTQICTRYLAWRLAMNSLQKGRDEKKDDPFFHYAAVHWPDHARASQESKDFPLDDVVRLSDTRSDLFAGWFHLCWRALHPYEKPLYKMNPIVAASFNGHQLVLEKILAAEEQEIDEGDGSGRTALMWASIRGHTKVAQLLIEKGADVNRCSPTHATSLQFAATNGHEEIVEVLLENGAAISQKGFNGNALWSGVAAGYTRIVRLLLDKSNISAKQGLDSALYLASTLGHNDIVELLLQKWIGSHSNGSLFEYVWIASFHGHDSVVDTLLNKQKKLTRNIPDCFFAGAIAAAASEDHRHVVKLLLDRADGYTTGEHLLLPMYTAAERSRDEVLHMLLEKAAQQVTVSLVAPKSTMPLPKVVLGSALQLAAGFGHEHLVRKFLNAKIKRTAFLKAFRAAIVYEHSPTIDILLETQMNATQQQLNELLDVAVSESSREMVTHLLDRGADPHELDRALLAAATKGDTKLIRFLIRRTPGGCRDSWERAFANAANKGQGKVMSMLLKADRDGDVLTGPLPPITKPKKRKPKRQSADFLDHFNDYSSSSGARSDNEDEEDGDDLSSLESFVDLTK